MAGTGSQLQGFDVLHSKHRWPEGDVYFCSGWGSDSYDGKNPDYPLKTIAAALDKCRSQRDDSIYVYASPGDTTFPIDIDVEGVHLYGFPYGFHDSCNINPTADTAGFLVTASKVTIDGFYVGGGDTHGCIEWDNEAKWLLRITNCNFGCFRGTSPVAPLYGFHTLDSQDCPYLVIADCYFGYAITSDGINIGNATRGFLGLPGHGNVFTLTQGGKGINVTGGGAVLSGIYDNKFSLHANTQGLAITLAGGNADCFIDGNSASYGYATQSAIPYQHGDGGNWGHNFHQEHIVLPA